MQPGVALLRALLVPHTISSSSSVFRVPTSILLAAMIAVVSLSALLVVTSQPRDLVRSLQITDGLDQLEALMLNAPPQQLERAKAGLIAQVDRRFRPLRTAASVLAEGVLSGALYLQIWLLVLLLSQFAGGEEQPLDDRRHARSRTLVLLCLIPLVLERLLAATAFTLTNPVVYAAVGTYGAYQDVARVSFSIAELAGLTHGEMPAALSFFFGRITDPFVWWSVYLLAFGAGPVFGLPVHRALLLFLMLLTILSLQYAAINQVGGFFA